MEEIDSLISTIPPSKTTKKKKKKPSKTSNFITNSASSSSSNQHHKGLRFRATGKSKHVSKVGEIDSLALPLGMSIAAFVSQVVDRKYIADERISTDHLSQICTSAVKESLANVYGDRFDRFVRNFAESFGCTLKTLRLVNQVSLNNGDAIKHIYEASLKSGELLGSSRSDGINSEASFNNEEHVNRPIIIDEHMHDPIGLFSNCSVCHSSEHENEASSLANVGLYAMNQELALHGETNQQLAMVPPRAQQNNSLKLNTFEKSVMEQSRSNDLKVFEIGLKMRELKLKESQLAHLSDSNRLDRFKISMNISKASFKEEKFKTQLEETRHAELLKKCVDCLVAGLFIMSASLIYGAYIYSYKRIFELTSSCTSPPKGSKSWWMPKQAETINSWWQSLSCYTVVWSRIMFGVFMILAIAYLLLQRSSTSRQMMPVTHIVFLLMIMCGTVGKLCVDTFGGNGYIWVLYWETLCLVHFLANIFTSTFFTIMHGSVNVTQEFRAKARLPFWARRIVFYSFILILPLLCGLMPYAGPSDWKDHFVSLARNVLFVSVGVEEEGN
ncbi:hypothetical protein ACHQM5_016652 [Ranunculus cassubicifolius]